MDSPNNFCQKCGQATTGSVRFCGHCGTSVLEIDNDLNSMPKENINKCSADIITSSDCKKKLYKWQNNCLWIIAIIAFVVAQVNYFDKFPLNGWIEKIVWILDTILVVGLDIAILWLIFFIGNRIYRKLKNR